MHEGLIEHTRYPRNPLDVLAPADRGVLRARRLVGRRAGRRRSAGPPTSPTSPTMSSSRCSICSRVATRPTSSPSCGPASCGTASRAPCGRGPGAQRLAVTSGGTIPDRGLFGVFLPDGTRVGELDEEMVYESRPGETFLLGASTWRIDDITHERVVVTPAPGQPGKMPFWHGDGPGPAARARAGPRRVRPHRAHPAARRRAGAAARSARPRPTGRRQPAELPRRAERGHRRGPRRSHHRRGTVP